jgi:hypothetical protein
MSKSRNKYLRRLAEPVFLPMDAERVPDDFEFESDSHPHVKVRAVTFGEMTTIQSVEPDHMPAEIAALIVGTGGDWGLCSMPAPGDDLERWLRTEVPIRDLNQIIRDIVDLNTVSDAAGNS